MIIIIKFMIIIIKLIVRQSNLISLCRLMIVQIMFMISPTTTTEIIIKMIILNSQKFQLNIYFQEQFTDENPFMANG